MTKRILARLLCLCVLAFTACGGTASEASSDERPTATLIKPATGYEETISDEPEEYDETETAETAIVIEPVIEAEYLIHNILTDYSENRAWIRYYDGNGDHPYGVYGLIDENGVLLLSLDAVEVFGANTVRATDFVNGISCIYAESGYYSGRRHEEGVVVVNRDGTVLFDSTSADEGYSYYYMGYDNGTILVVENVSGFEADEYYICEIDLQGEIVSRIEYPYSWSNYSIHDNFRYIGENLYYGDCSKSKIIYNSATKTFFHTDDESPFIENWYGCAVLTDIIDGHVLIRNHPVAGNQDVFYTYRVPFEILTNHDIWKAFDPDSELIGTFYPSRIAEGYITDASGVYNYYGELVASFPEGWQVDSVSAFSNGYAAMYLTGADRNDYITVIDATGKAQYDPIKCNHHDSSFYEGYMLIDVDGIMRILAPTGMEISDTEYFRIRNGECRWGTSSEGFVDVNDITMNSVYIISNYDEITGMTYDEIAGITSNFEENNSSNEVSNSKTYINLSDFVIEGKWKNIGEYTFGQVQNGAIVVFDGSNCNFYSPSDTYAFYEKQSAYQLDCTSLLGETVSFLVRIVDEDHVDIYNGSNYLELERMN